jgi:hypothetical protein
MSSVAKEVTDYFIFKSKHLVFKIKTRVANLHRNASYVVRRFEGDFYTLRNILVLSYGQCFIPPLWPKDKEVTWDKRSISLRERTFSRFLRSIVRSPQLASHPIVFEFLKTDHHHTDPKNGMRYFSKELQAKEQEIIKMNSYYDKVKMSNGIYRITSTLPKISLKEDYTANLLADKQINQLNFNEKEYVLRYEKNITAILGLLGKFHSQIYDLKSAYGQMQENLLGLSEVHEEDEELNLMRDAYRELSILFGCSHKEGMQMLNKLGALLDCHFLHQNQIVQQSMTPFVSKITDAEKHMLANQRGFLKEREEAL